MQQLQANGEGRQLRRLARAVEQSPLSIVITDVHGTIQYVNANFTRATGYEREEVIGKTPRLLKSDETPPAIYAELWATITAGAEWRGELCNIRKNGEKFWERVTISPVVGPDGQVESYVGLKEDISELKAARRALACEHGKTANILESMKDEVCLIDDAGTIVYVNPAMERKLGPGRGRAGHEYFGVEARVIADAPGPTEWTIMRTGQTYEVSRSAVESSDGRPLTLYVLHDITTLKEIEATLERARVAAEAASQAKARFLATMSHELRTPLNAIIGFSEMLSGQFFGALGEKYLDYARDINKSGQHLLQLVTDILDLSAIEIGGLTLCEHLLDVPDAVWDAVTTVSRDAMRRDIRIGVDVPADLPPLLADAERLKQILVNLLSNAVKFTPAGGKVRIAVALECRGGMRFEVSDTGIGMGADDIPKALTPFAQVDDRLARNYDGSGLGLPLAKSLVEMHGGQLELRSEPNVGTTATVRFPPRRVRGGFRPMPANTAAGATGALAMAGCQ